MGVRATCTVDKLHRERKEFAEENEWLNKEVKRLEQDLDKLERGETAKVAEVMRQNQQLEDRNVQLAAKLAALDQS